MKVAVIGCGTIANSAHIPSYLLCKDLCEIKYFCDIIPEKAQTRHLAKLHSTHSTPTTPTSTKALSTKRKPQSKQSTASV